MGQTDQTRRVETPRGPIEYRLTVKPVKNLNLRLGPDGIPAVSVPRRVSAAAADAFVRDHADWILRHQAAQAVRPEPVPFPTQTEALPALTAAVERMWPLAAPLGVKKPAVKGRRMVSRWGSCHWTKGVVVLNTALAAMPESLLDYVALHELVHFLHPNHGPGFYRVMDRLMPDWRARRRALRQYRLEKTTG